jgi:CBS-domain-containing membrane protein
VEILTDLAIGMLAGTAGTHGSARGRMTILAAVIGLVAGFLMDGPEGAVAAAAGAALGCIVISDVVYGASRREGSGAGALAFIVALAAVVVVGIALFLEPAVIVVVLALIWLGVTRHRRAQRKHAGLRVLR